MIIDIIFAFCFDFLVIYFPSKKPNNVNVKLNMEKYKLDNIIFDVMYVIPAPISKLSIDTKNANVIDSKKLIFFSLISSLNDFIISISIIISVNMRINLESIV